MNRSGSIADVWARLTLAGGLSSADSQAFLKLRVKAIALQAGDTIGVNSQHCSVVLSGYAYRSMMLSDGARQIIAVHIAGDFLNTADLYARSAAAATHMLTSGHVLQVPIKDLQSYLLSRPLAQKIVWRQHALESAISAEWLAGVGRRDAKARIAHLLCEFATRLRLRGLRAEDLPMTQAQIADATGLTAVHVNRILQQLREEGALENTQGSLAITDWGRLISYADFDPEYLNAVEVKQAE